MANGQQPAAASAQQLTPQQFAARVRAKYPGAYDDLSDTDLTQKVLTKYPEYSDMVSMPTGGQATDSGPMSASERRAVPFTSGQSMPGSFEGHLENIAQWAPGSFGEIYGGVRDVMSGDIAGGLHRIIGGVG